MVLRPSFRRRLGRLEPDDQMATLVALVRNLEIVVLSLLVAMLLGGFVLYQVLASRSVTREANNARFNVLECIALVNTPPSAIIHTELQSLHPDCRYVDAVKTPKPSPVTRTATATRTVRVPRSRAPRTRTVQAPQPTPSETHPHRSRTPARSTAPARPTPSRTRPRTPTPAPSPTCPLLPLLPPGVLCGLPI